VAHTAVLFSYRFRTVTLPMAKAMLPARPPCLTASAYRNVCRCRGVTTAAKSHYLKAISACKKNLTCAKSAHDSQIAGRARIGPIVDDLIPDEGLGVLIEEVAFIKHIAPLFKKSVSRFRDQVNAMLAYYEKRESGAPFTDSEKLAAHSFMNTQVPPRSDGSIWLFRNPNRRRDAFDELLDEWLGHRLGLDVSPAGETRLAFCFLAGHVQDVHRPTFYDTTWTHLTLWSYSGVTRPLPGTPARSTGLEEVVAFPPEIGRTSRPIVRVQLQRR
jgi:hypothetical protein